MESQNNLIFTVYYFITLTIIVKYFVEHRNYWLFALYDLFIIVLLDHILFEWCLLHINEVLLYLSLFICFFMIQFKPKLSYTRPYTYELWNNRS